MPITDIRFTLYDTTSEGDNRLNNSITQDGDLITIDPEVIGITILNKHPKYDICKCKFWGNVQAENGTIIIFRTSNYEYEIYDPNEASKEQLIAIINKYQNIKIDII